MIRIIGLQRDDAPEREFVLLQNQGSMRASLRGHVLLSESSLETSDLSFGAHAITDEALIPPGMYVILFTGSGEPRWGRTKDGAMVFHSYMNRPHTVWSRCPGALHLLHAQHTYVERPEPALLLR